MSREKFAGVVLRAITYGPEVRLLARGRGTVLAVLRNAIYLASERGEIVGVLGQHGSSGPISLRVRGFERVLLARGLRVGLPFSGDGEAITIERLARIEFKLSSYWEPAMPPASSTEDERAADLLAAIVGHSPSAGFGTFARQLAVIARGDQIGLAQIEGSDTLARRALPNVIAFERALSRQDAAASAAAAAELLGLGPGLTPSGDDFLSGLLAVAFWQRERQSLTPDLMGYVTEQIVAAAPARTTRLSARLLAHAANGLLYEPGMALGWALFGSRSTVTTVAARQLFELGHTSGMDIACGVLFGALLLSKPN